MKKVIAILLAVIIIVGAGLFFGLNPEKTVYLPSDYESVNHIAHRGLSALAPENTLASFRLAGENGYYGCECDIYPTTDGKWAIIHDPKINRVTNGKGKVLEMSYEEMLQYDIDSGSNVDKYPNEKIPELNDYLDICVEYDMLPVVEIKGGNEAQMAELAKLLKSRKDVKELLMISFLKDNLLWLKKEMPDTEMWLLCEKLNDEEINFCLENGFEGIDFNFKKAGSKMIEKVKQSGLKCGVWTINYIEIADKAALLDFEYITTNGLRRSLKGDSMFDESKKDDAGYQKEINIKAFLTRIKTKVVK